MQVERKTDAEENLVPVANLLRFVGKELQRLRETTEGLQSSMSEVVTAGSLNSDSPVNDLHHLDELTQVLDNLSQFQGKLAEMLAQDNLVDPRLALSDINLDALRSRLMGLDVPQAPDSAGSGDIDFF